MPASAPPRETAVPMPDDGAVGPTVGPAPGFGLLSGGRSVKYGELPVAPSAPPAAPASSGAEVLAPALACRPASPVVAPGAWEADRAATANAAAAVVAAPLRSRLPNCAAIR